MLRHIKFFIFSENWSRFSIFGCKSFTNERQIWKLACETQKSFVHVKIFSRNVCRYFWGKFEFSSIFWYFQDEKSILCLLHREYVLTLLHHEDQFWSAPPILLSSLSDPISCLLYLDLATNMMLGGFFVEIQLFVSPWYSSRRADTNPAWIPWSVKKNEHLL